MWRYWRIVDPRIAIIGTGLLIAFVSTSIHLVQISGDRYNINTWHPDTAKATAARAGAAMQNTPNPSK
jgi:hypothetical protein